MFGGKKSKKRIEAWAGCGDDYYYGQGGETVDYEMAVIFYQKAAAQNHPRACRMLGLCLENGHGVEKDADKAEYWYRRAADLGDESAQKRFAAPENKNFWAQYAAGQRDMADLRLSLALPAHDKDYTRAEIERALRQRRKSELSGSGGFAVLTLALLLVKVRLGGAALFDGAVVRAYLTDFLPRIHEMRRLSALVFETGAIGHLRGEPGLALERLQAAGLSGHEAQRLVDCFAAAFALRVDYGDLPGAALLAAAECGDAEAMYVLACRYHSGEGPTDDENNVANCRRYLQTAMDLGHGPAAGLLETALFEDTDVMRKNKRHNLRGDKT